jgi:hypothetical protein
MFLNIPYGEMSDIISGEIDSVNAILSSIKASDIPLASGVDIETLKAADTDPLEIVVEIPATKSKRGWNYTTKSLQDIVDYTKQYTLNGFLGHQKPENVSTEFVPPVTHWIGAEMKGDKAYFRGIVDADATNLKRWLRTKRIQEVSIFGYPKLKKGAKGEMNVVGYEPLSIDWTPLHRPGMPTSIVAMEMNDPNGEQLDGTFENLKVDLREALKEKYNANDNGTYLWIQNIRYDNSTAIFELEQSGVTKLYSIDFSIVENNLQLGEAVEVVKKISYEPAGEMNEGGKVMEFNELAKNVKGLLQIGKISYSDVVTGLGLTPEVVAGEMEEVKASMDAKDILEKVRETLGLSGEMDVVEYATKAQNAIIQNQKETWNNTLNEVIGEKVVGEMAQGLVKKMLKAEEGATKEVIAGEIDTILQDDLVRNLISSSHKDVPPGTNAKKDNNNNIYSSSVRVKKTRI